MFKTIAITGTNGKTTSAFLTKHILNLCGKKVGLVSTLGNYIDDKIVHFRSIGLEEKLEYFRKNGCDYVIFEAYSRPLSMKMWDNLHFDIGVFTNLTEDHLDIHKTMKKYAEAKSKLFELCDVSIGNVDDPWFEQIVKGEQIFTFGISEKADLRATNISLNDSNVAFNVGDTFIEYSSLGLYSVYNALTAIAIVKHLGIPPHEAAKAIKMFKNVKGRLEEVDTKQDFRIFIDYAHSPDAMEQVLKAIKPLCKGRLVVLFGCGGNRDKRKRPLMGTVAAKYSDYVIITSDNPRDENPKMIIDDIIPGIHNTETTYKIILNREYAIEHVIKTHLPNDVVVLLGKGHEKSQIIGKQFRHFDERKIIKEALNE